jgi:outer membrane receptor protein involved in Fe transport
LLLEDSFVDVVKQFEAGVKWQTKDVLPGRLDANATYFHADTEESQTNTTQTPPTPFNIAYRSYGIELDGSWTVGAFRFDGSTTWTHARITSYASNPALVGNKPRRQADFIWNLNGSYRVGVFDFGANINGTTDSYAGFTNLYIQPGYSVVNAYINWHLSDALVATLSANNLFDKVGITEAEEDSGRLFDTNNDGRIDTTSARSIAGRTISARLRYSF